jgi:hypothetical protein
MTKIKVLEHKALITVHSMQCLMILPIAASNRHHNGGAVRAMDQVDAL